MSAELQLLEDTLGAIMGKHGTDTVRAHMAVDAIPEDLWRTLEDAGLTDLCSPAGGGGLAELVVVARAVGRAAAPVPLVESGLASWLIRTAELEAPPGITTCAVSHRSDQLVLSRTASGWAATGVLNLVPWGGQADHVVAFGRAEGGELAVAVLPRGGVVERGRNLAGEPRDTLRYEDTPLKAGAVGTSDAVPDGLLRRGALLRAAAIAGATGRVLDLTLDYAQAREQFGRPIAAFQAVQHHLVAIAEEASCVDIAVRAAALGCGDERLAVAAAKVTAAGAAAEVARRAHQVFGAIGATQEHVLHLYTRRLWSWQDEFGTERLWSARLGRDCVDAGPDALWPSISANPGPTDGWTTAEVLG